MGIELEKIIKYLGEPLKKSGHNLIWKCPYCEDKSKNNLIYSTEKCLLSCFASGNEHSKRILSEINKNFPEKIYKKPPIISPVKKILSPNKIQYFNDIMNKSNNELLNNTKMLDFLEEKRGINTKTVKECLIGVDIEKQHFVFPTFEYMTNTVIGFEYRPLDLSKNIKREIGGLTGLAQINQFSGNTVALAILGGYLDCYAFYQYLSETGQAKYYHITTSSNGEGAILRYLEDVKGHFNKYNRIYLYLDTDKTGIEQMEKIKNKFPYVEIKTMTCGCKDFNEHYLKCIKPKVTMPEPPKYEVLNVPSINPYANMIELHTSHSNGLLEYKINADTRKLIIGNSVYDIPEYFNIENALNGDYKTLDYIFNSCGLDIKQYRIRVEGIKCQSQTDIKT